MREDSEKLFIHKLQFIEEQGHFQLCALGIEQERYYYLPQEKRVEKPVNHNYVT